MEYPQVISFLEGYLDNSFDTIAGYGKNGAIVHYVAEVALKRDIQQLEFESMLGLLKHPVSNFKRACFFVAQRLQTLRLLERSLVFVFFPNLWPVEFKVNQGLDSFLLLDSGAQYVDGTTDVTRTPVAYHSGVRQFTWFTHGERGVRLSCGCGKTLAWLSQCNHFSCAFNTFATTHPGTLHFGSAPTVEERVLKHAQQHLDST